MLRASGFTKVLLLQGRPHLPGLPELSAAPGKRRMPQWTATCLGVGDAFGACRFGIPSLGVDPFGSIWDIWAMAVWTLGDYRKNKSWGIS